MQHLFQKNMQLDFQNFFEKFFWTKKKILKLAPYIIFEVFRWIETIINFQIANC
jgi:hypothetical protein